MKKRNILLIAIFILFAVIVFLLKLGRYQQDEDLAEKKAQVRQFQREIVKVLNLKYVSYNPLYASSYVRIIKDTIVGYNIGTNGIAPGFFFQSLTPLDTTTFIEKTFQENDPLPLANYINYFKNGCIYFGAYGGSYMQRVCIDGSTQSYFKTFEQTLFYANKVLCYKDKAVITSMNGIYIFDIKNEKLLWSEKYGNDLYDGFSVIIDKKFYYVSINGMLVCVNLENLKKEWETMLDIKMNSPYGDVYQELQTLYHSDKVVVINGIRKIILIDIKTGKIIWSFPWNIRVLVDHPAVKFVGKWIYFSNQKKLYCIDYTTNKIAWELNNATFQALYKDYVIGISKDLNYYLIINKDTGKIIAKIKNPKDGYLISFVDEYVIVNSKTIYK